MPTKAQLTSMNDEYEEHFFYLYGVLNDTNILEDDTPKTLEMIEIVEKTIKQLQEENEELKENQSHFQNSSLNSLQKIMELVRENKNLKDRIKEVDKIIDEASNDPNIGSFKHYTKILRALDLPR